MAVPPFGSAQSRQVASGVWGGPSPHLTKRKHFFPPRTSLPRRRRTRNELVAKGGGRWRLRRSFPWVRGTHPRNICEELSGITGSSPHPVVELLSRRLSRLVLNWTGARLFRNARVSAHQGDLAPRCSIPQASQLGQVPILVVVRFWSAGIRGPCLPIMGYLGQKRPKQQSIVA